MEADRMVYIKDYWRAEGGEKEGEIYRSPEEKNVPNISRFYCGNDVCHEICDRKGTRQCRKPKHQIGPVPGQARSDIIEWL